MMSLPKSVVWSIDHVSLKLLMQTPEHVLQVVGLPNVTVYVCVCPNSCMETKRTRLREPANFAVSRDGTAHGERPRRTLALRTSRRRRTSGVRTRKKRRTLGKHRQK